MKVSPILFKGPLVRAIRAGVKTQTRRMVKPPRGYNWLDVAAGTMVNSGGHKKHVSDVACPYQPGDRLWVREPWRALRSWDSYAPSLIAPSAAVWYEADDADGPPDEPHHWGKLRPAMFMPRWACRLELEVTDVRVERLQAISEADALAEGITSVRCQEWDRAHFATWRYLFDQAVEAGTKPPVGPTPAQSYAALWESINGPGSWDANPWVWVYSFKVAEAA